MKEIEKRGKKKKENESLVQSAVGRNQRQNDEATSNVTGK